MLKPTADGTPPEMYPVRVAVRTFNKDGTFTDSEPTVLKVGNWYGRGSLGADLGMSISAHAFYVMTSNHGRPNKVTLLAGPRMAGKCIEVLENGVVVYSFIVPAKESFPEDMSAENISKQYTFKMKLIKLDAAGKPVKERCGFRVKTHIHEGKKKDMDLDQQFEVIFLGLVEPGKDELKPSESQKKGRKGVPKKLVLPKKNETTPYVPTLVDWGPLPETAPLERPEDIVKHIHSAEQKRRYAERLSLLREDPIRAELWAPSKSNLRNQMAIGLFNLRRKVRTGRFGPKPQIEEAKDVNKPCTMKTGVKENWAGAKGKLDPKAAVPAAITLDPKLYQQAVNEVVAKYYREVAPENVLDIKPMPKSISVENILLSLPPPDLTIKSDVSAMKKAYKASIDDMIDIVKAKDTIALIDEILGNEKRAPEIEEGLLADKAEAKKAIQVRQKRVKDAITGCLGLSVFPKKTICFVRTKDGMILKGHAFSAEPGQVVGYDMEARKTLIRIGEGPMSTIKGFCLPNPLVYFSYHDAVSIPEKEKGEESITREEKIRRHAIKGRFVMPGTPVFVRPVGVRPVGALPTDYVRGTIIFYDDMTDVITVRFEHNRTIAEFEMPNKRVFFTSWAAKQMTYFIRVPGEEPLPGNRYSCLEATAIGRAIGRPGFVLLSFNRKQVPLEMELTDPLIFNTFADAVEPLPPVDEPPTPVEEHLTPTDSKRPREDDDEEEEPDAKKPRTDDESSDPESPILRCD